MRYHCCYITTNTVNGKSYVGMHSTDNLQDGYIGSGIALWSAVETREQRSKALKGRVFSSETLDKMSKSQKNNTRTCSVWDGSRKSSN